MKDFTAKQAQQWVDQEFAKVTQANALSRFNSEQKMIAFSAKYPTLKNSAKAHVTLRDQIAQAFNVGATA